MCRKILGGDSGAVTVGSRACARGSKRGGRPTGTFDKLFRSKWEVPGHTESGPAFWFGMVPGFRQTQDIWQLSKLSSSREKHSTQIDSPPETSKIIT